MSILAIPRQMARCAKHYLTLPFKRKPIPPRCEIITNNNGVELSSNSQCAYYDRRANHTEPPLFMVKLLRQPRRTNRSPNSNGISLEVEVPNAKAQLLIGQLNTNNTLSNPTYLDYTNPSSKISLGNGKPTTFFLHPPQIAFTARLAEGSRGIRISPQKLSPEQRKAFQRQFDVLQQEAQVRWELSERGLTTEDITRKTTENPETMTIATINGPISISSLPTSIANSTVTYYLVHEGSGKNLKYRKLWAELPFSWKGGEKLVTAGDYIHLPIMKSNRNANNATTQIQDSTQPGQGNRNNVNHFLQDRFLIKIQKVMQRQQVDNDPPQFTVIGITLPEKEEETPMLVEAQFQNSISPNRSITTEYTGHEMAPQYEKFSPVLGDPKIVSFPLAEDFPHTPELAFAMNTSGEILYGLRAQKNRDTNANMFRVSSSSKLTIFAADPKTHPEIAEGKIRRHGDLESLKDLHSLITGNRYYLESGTIFMRERQKPRNDDKPSREALFRAIVQNNEIILERFRV